MKIDLNAVFQRYDAAGKPANEAEARAYAHCLSADDLSDAERVAVAALPVVTGKGQFTDSLLGVGPDCQFFVFKMRYGQAVFLANSEGYKYPRYVLRLSPELVKQLGIVV